MAARKAKAKAKPARAKPARAKPVRTSKPARAKPARAEPVRTSKPAPAKPVRTSKPAPSSPAPALLGTPTLWAAAIEGTQAIGLHVDDNEVWGGWETGDVVAFDHAGEVLRRWKLPSGVNALVADDVWRYAACDDGNVYDISSSRPRVAYEIDPDTRVLFLDVFRGRLVAADDDGTLTAFDAEGTRLFRHETHATSQGWLALADQSGAYVGHYRGVAKVDWSGKVLWSAKTKNIGFGTHDDAELVAYEGDVETSAVLRLDKATGKVLARGSCFSSAPYFKRANNAASCAGDADRIFGGTGAVLFAFDRKSGAKQWEAPIKWGSPCSMALHADRLFMVTSAGVLACADVSSAAIEAAKAKAPKLPKQRWLDREREETTRAVDDANDGGGNGGVVVECVKDGSKLRVRVVSAGFRSDWFCQFPRDIREPGAKFVVDEVREADGFYRVRGEIRRVRA